MLTVVFLTFPAFSYATTLGQMHISLIEGDVQIYTEDTGDWVPASINLPLKDGDRIWVPAAGRLEIRFRDGTALRLDERTALDILTFEKDSYQFYLAEGRAYINFRGARGSYLQIETPISSIRAYDRAIFRIDIMDDRQTDISVYQGYVYAESRDGRVRIEQDRTLVLKEGYPAELGPMGPPDEWERWNRSRNRIYAEGRTPSRYLPEELHPYSSDFEEHGRWVYVREYGYVWTPTVVVSAGWAPYRVGRWVWIRGDYVWISYEPWGWVPYHYGRWIFVPPFGWCWVPPLRGTVYWGPGFVGWVRTPTYVSWVPLAPREIYYGYGYYGPYSVNIININITTINVKKIVYKNVHVHNAVTVVHHDTFVRGKHVDIKIGENPFLKNWIHIGRPDIKPERPTVMPVIREIHPEKRPPEKIDKINMREIKERRPLIREREASVMKPESPAREMNIKRREERPVEKGIDRIGEQPSPKAIERREAPKPSPGEMERPIERQPKERVERPVETKPAEKGFERSKERQTSPERTEKQLEIRPQEKMIEKPAERTPPPGVERPREERKSIELEREIPKTPDQRRIEREREIQKEIRPERGLEKPQEIRPQVRETERPRETLPRERGGLRSPHPESSQEDASPRIERRPESRVEKPQEMNPLERETDKIKEPPRGGEGRGRSPDPESRRGRHPSKKEQRP